VTAFVPVFAMFFHTTGHAIRCWMIVGMLIFALTHKLQ
jgi:hypothetical protein